MIGRLMMILVGLVLAQLGVITFIHSDHNVVGVLLLGGGILSMLEGLPHHEWF